MAGRFGAAIELMRPKNLILAGSTVPLGAYFGLMDSSEAFPYLAVALHTLAVITFTGAGNSMNDIKDTELDKAAHPTRPLPSGRLTVDDARRFTALLWCVSVVSHIGGLVVVSAEVSVYLPTALIYVLAVALMVTYDQLWNRVDWGKELENVAGDPQHAALVKRLSALLRAGPQTARARVS